MIDVLLVDDSTITRQAQRRMLSIAGVPTRTVVEAADGLEAVEEMKKHKFDLVLCDLNMPRMGGVAVLVAVRKDPELHNPPVIFVTSDHSDTRRERLMQAGATAFICKPLSPEKLRSVLNEVMPSIWEAA